MTTATLSASIEKDLLNIHLSTGVRIKRSRSFVETNRGSLTPCQAQPEHHSVHQQLHTKRLSARAIEFWHTIQNRADQPLDITRIVLFDGALELDGSGWRVAHSELSATEDYFNGYTLATGNFFASIPGVDAQLGKSQNTPFPAIILTHPERGSILIGVLSQEHSKPLFTLSPQGRHTQLIAEDFFTGVPHIRVQPGERFESERWCVLFSPSSSPEGFDEIIDDYFRLLDKRITFVGKNSVLREAVLWGTWTLTVRLRGHGDIAHAWIIATARAMRKLVPDKPRFVMIDDGYQAGRSQWQTDASWFASCLEIFAPEHDGLPHDPKLFPQGMKATASAIRKAGAQPAIWTTPRIDANSALAKHHPDWLLRTTDGRPFGKKSAFLDYSIPEVRAYTINAWRTLTQEWGFTGIKLDFWTFPFEVPETRFTHHDRTAVQLRNLFLQDLRDCLPDDAGEKVAVVVNGGNPFMGRYVDAARIGMDIGMGNWRDLHASSQSVTLSAPFYRHDRLLADADTIAWNPRNTADENRLWATMAMMTGSVCEIGGDLTTLTAEARNHLQLVTRFFRPSLRTRTSIAGPGINHVPPSHLVLQRDDSSFEAHLNWHNIPRIVQLHSPVTDLWTGQKLQGDIRIPPHGAILFKQ